jgi:hypothetical protein
MPRVLDASTLLTTFQIHLPNSMLIVFKFFSQAVVLHLIYYFAKSGNKTVLHGLHEDDT